MSDVNQSAVEAVARAICEADGFCPEDDVVGGQAQSFENYGPRWSAGHNGCLGETDYVRLAIAALAAMPAAQHDLGATIDRPVILAAARAWWDLKMVNTHIRAIIIGGDGRVRVTWCDHEESGKFTLPVDFMSAQPDQDKLIADLREELEQQADGISVILSFLAAEILPVSASTLAGMLRLQESSARSAIAKATGEAGQ